VPVNKKFQKHCEAFYHILNIYTEPLAPELAASSREVWTKVRSKRDPSGYLSEVKCHLLGQYIRFNAGTGFHCDSASSWCGYDVVTGFGKYEGGLLEFPGLGYALPSNPSDLFFFRGAGIMHDATSWEGEGRMVIALFSDRRVFTFEGVRRPKDLGKTYGRAKHKAFRKMFPCHEAFHPEPEQTLKRKHPNRADGPRKKRCGVVE
jgi:hypothetical protein